MGTSYINLSEEEKQRVLNLSLNERVDLMADYLLRHGATMEIVAACHGVDEPLVSALHRLYSFSRKNGGKYANSNVSRNDISDFVHDWPNGTLGKTTFDQYLKEQREASKRRELERLAEIEEERQRQAIAASIERQRREREAAEKERIRKQQEAEARERRARIAEEERLRKQQEAEERARQEEERKRREERDLYFDTGRSAHDAGLYDQAISWYLKAVKLGADLAINNLGCCYAAKGDCEKALEYFIKAAENGDMTGAFNAARYYKQGIGTEVNKRKALEYFEQAIGGDNSDEAEVEAELLRREFAAIEAAEQAYDDAQSSNDPFSLYKQCYETENKNKYLAALELGRCYYSGRGVAEDSKAAFELFCEAREHGVSEANIDLGRCYYYGIGTGQDYNTAIQYLKPAAEQGNSEAQLLLGVIFKDGLAGEKDPVSAFNWFDQACQQQAAAAFYCADFLEHGIGRAVNKLEARKYYNKAIARKQYNPSVAEEAKEALENMLTGLTEEERTAFEAYDQEQENKRIQLEKEKKESKIKDMIVQIGGCIFWVIFILLALLLLWKVIIPLLIFVIKALFGFIKTIFSFILRHFIAIILGIIAVWLLLGVIVMLVEKIKNG